MRISRGNLLLVIAHSGNLLLSVQFWRSEKSWEKGIYTIGCGFGAAWIYAWVRSVKNLFCRELGSLGAEGEKKEHRFALREYSGQAPVPSAGLRTGSSASLRTTEVPGEYGEEVAC